MSLNINMGRGQSPIKGWQNYDNSWSVRLAKIPLLAGIMGKLGLLSKPQQEFMAFTKNASIRWADATKQIPEKNGTVDVIYSSHMMEHLEKEDATKFIKEARRVLKSGGIIRIAVPNIRYYVENYLKDNDADNFIERTLLTKKNPKTIIAKIKYLISGDRNHQWMYDGESMCKLLSSVGFNKPKAMDPGTTIITEIGELDLEERLPESRIGFMPYCVDNEYFHRRAENADTIALAQSFSLKSGIPVILYASKLNGRKHADQLLAAYSQLDGHRPYLLFVGDGELLPTLKNMAEENKLDNVRFLGFLNQSELPAFYALADIFVLPSVNEPWGLVVNEAMNASCAIVVTTSGG